MAAEGYDCTATYRWVTRRLASPGISSNSCGSNPAHHRFTFGGRTAGPHHVTGCITAGANRRRWNAIEKAMDDDELIAALAAR